MKCRNEAVVENSGPKVLYFEIPFHEEKAMRNPEYPMNIIEFPILHFGEKKHEEKTKNTTFYEFIERIEISGEEAHVAIGCYPRMQIVTQKIVKGKSVYVVEYPGPLTDELLQKFSEMWDAKIVKRRQLWRKIRQA